MDDEERQHLEALLQIHRRNLRRLELRAAEHGLMGTPTSLNNEIEMERAAIAQVEVHLNSFRNEVVYGEVSHSEGREVIKVSILSQILLVLETIERMFYQPLQHAMNRVQAVILRRNNPSMRAIDSIDYPVANMVYHLGRLLAQLQTFRTYQYIQIQNQLKFPEAMEDIHNIKELLSQQGIYRSYQDELASYTLTTSFSDLEAKVRLNNTTMGEPLFLKAGISWAEQFIIDFGTAWTNYFDQLPGEGYPTLAERNIDLSMFPVRDYSRGPSKNLNVSQLRINDISAEFVQLMSKFYIDLKTFFTKIEN